MTTKKIVADKLPPRDKLKPRDPSIDPRQTSISFDPKDDRTRQEFKASTDIKTILLKHGGVPPGRPLTFGEVDYSLDLQTALSTARNAEQAWSNVPIALRRDYPNWQSLLNALQRGDVEIADGKLRQVDRTPPDEPEAPETPEPAAAPKPKAPAAKKPAEKPPE